MLRTSRRASRSVGPLPASPLSHTHSGLADDPAEDEEAVGDPYKTLFVGRLPYACTEADLRREFEMYGPLERVRVVRNKDGKSRGYAFLVYEREKDMKGSFLPRVMGTRS